MEASHSSVDSLQLVNYALRVGFVEWKIYQNWAWVLMNMALVLTVIWAFRISRWVKHAQSRPAAHSTATDGEDCTAATGKQSTSSSKGGTNGSVRSMGDFLRGRIYIKCDSKLDELSPKQGSCLEDAEVLRGRNPALCSYSFTANIFSMDKCLDCAYSIIGISCSRANVISVWDKRVGKCVHDINMDEYAITTKGNCLIQNSQKSVLPRSIVWSGEEKSCLCLWDRRQSMKPLSFSLRAELSWLHAVEFNDTKICVSDGLNGKLFDLRMAASPVVEVYPTSKRMDAPIGRRNPSAKTWNYLKGLVLENTTEFAFSERGKHGIMEWRNASISCSGSLPCMLK